MNINYAKFAGKAFKVSKFADDFTDQLKGYLSLDDRASVARLSIGRSLCEDSIPAEIDGEISNREIKGVTLLGDDPLTWVSLVVSHAELVDPTESDITDLIRRHWHRGARLLSKDWKSADKDLVKFLERLAMVAELPFAGASVPVSLGESVGPVKIRLGEIGQIAGSFDNKVAEWVLNGPGTSPHFAIFGKSGSGKTRTAKSIYKQVATKYKIPMIIFDPKGDLGTDPDFVSETNAEVIRIGQDPIPLNCLEYSGTDNFELLRVRDSFCEAIKLAVNLGQVQTDKLRTITKDCLQSRRNIGTTEVAQAVVDEYRDTSTKSDILLSICNSISEYKLFSSSMGCNEFFSKTWIISANQASDEQIKLCLLLLLNTLLRWLRAMPDSSMTDNYRNIRLLLSCDEARIIFDLAESSTLEGLVLECRSKGLSCFFLSQSPDHVDRGSDEILSQLSTVASFDADLRREATGKRLFGDTFTAARLTRLDTGRCLAKLPELGTVVVHAWSR
jgi:DNA sulfur modification protein DndE